MSAGARRKDWVDTQVAIPGAVLHVLLPAIAAVTAWLLVPVLGWQVAAVSTALIGMLLPQTLGGWFSIACLAVGMLLSETSIWLVSLAVLLVHIIHVLSALLPVVPWRGRVVIAALWPTLRRLFVVQLIAQPITIGVMLVWTSTDTVIGGAALIGAAGLVGFSILFLQRVGRWSQRA